MLSVNSFGRGLKAALALTLITPATYAQTAATTAASVSSSEWIYPGQPLPSDVGFTPLRAGAEAASDVKLIPRDWFLLKDKGLSLFSPSSANALEYQGPVLDEVNAQLYYRLTSGMILKESMMQMGMNSAQAQRFVEQARLDGKDFDKTPLADLGPLPQGFEDLYRNWERPMARMAMLPYLMLPLSIGHEQSQFQHFSLGAIGDTTPAPGVKMCSTMKNVAPLAGIQSKIDTTKTTLDGLNLELRKAQGLAEQSNAELVRLTAKVKEQSARIERDMSCFSSIKDRISRGSAMPAAECLQIAKNIFIEAKMQSQWDKFTSVNINNSKGDFQVLQEEDIHLKSSEAALQALRLSAQSLQDEKSKVAAEKNQNEEKLNKLSADKDLQLAGEAKLNAEQDALNQEIQTLQNISHKLETGVLSTELPEADVKTQIAGTAARSERILQIKARLPQILQEKSQVQQNLAAILAQAEFLGRAIDTNRLKIESIEAQLSGPNSDGLLAQLKKQEESAKAANTKYLDASKQSNFSEYVISILTKDLIMDTQFRDQNFELLRKEEVLLASYKAQIEAASKTKDSQWDRLQADLRAQQQIIASYRDPKEMGWFLEADCENRGKFDSDATGIYLSRAPITDNSIAAVGTRANTGKWGLFSMPYDQFRSSIQNGVLLNTESYIRLSVQKMFENYDYSMAQFMNPTREQCADVTAAKSGVGASILGLLKSAFSIWDMGSDEPAKASGYCAVAPAVAAPASTFAQSLAQLIQFENSVLDQTLPKRYQSRPEDLIEREAIESLSLEIALLTGSTPSTQTAVQDSASRREALIKSLIKVLAYDYTEASNKSREQDPQRSKYRFASPAPGKSISPLVSVGSVQEIRSLDGIALYTSPIARPEHETNIILSMGDKVHVLAIDGQDPNTAILAGWMKVQATSPNGAAASDAYYMPSAALSPDAVISDSAFDLGDEDKCPVRRVVKTLTNFNNADKLITRMLPNLQTGLFKNGMWQMVRANSKASPASTDKTYIACELFAREGQRASPLKTNSYKDDTGVDFGKVQGIRIVEAKIVKSRTGQIRYVPVEEVGGYVHTWLAQKSTKQPRIILGPELDSNTWSIKQ